MRQGRSGRVRPGMSSSGGQEQAFKGNPVFDSLTEKFNSVFKSLSGRGRITEANISDAMRDVRKALLEADVNYNVVKQFCKDVREAALGAEVIKSLHPGQVMIKIVNDELTKLMGAGRYADLLRLAGTDDHHAGRSPGLWQDHHGRQAGQLSGQQGPPSADGRR